jgi:hypothetical protein
MDIRRINDDRQFQDGGLPEPEGLSALRQAREESDALLRAADDVINRVLSRDSEEFLQQARQHGGQ